jgi:D-amino-acid dehydrogenase
MTRHQPDVLIVGGGVIGLSAAYYLAREGAKVRLLERGQLGQGASHGNAGLIVPSYCVPLATPARLFEALHWGFGRGSPISMEFRENPGLLGWLLRFVASCTSRQATATTQLLFDLGRMSLDLFKGLPGLDQECGFQQSGWLHLYRTEVGLERAATEAGVLNRAGVRSQALSPQEILELEPLARPDLAGGILYPDEAHLTPDRFTAHLARLARDLGAELHEQVDVTSWEQHHGQVQAVVANGASHRAEYYILAAGAWSPCLTRGLGLRLPLQAARGYSVDFAASHVPLQRPLLLGEAHVIARPLDDRNRITGGFELAGPDSGLTPSMPMAILHAPNDYLSKLGPASSQAVWSGFRPASADGMPFIGPTTRFPNLLLATGHGTLGMTLSLVTGQLLTDLIRGRQLPADLRRLLPARVGL